MSDGGPLPGDQARVSVHIKVPVDEAFRVFTEEIDLWWRRGPRFRAAGSRGVICIEPRVGGRLFESLDEIDGTRLVETGRVTVWEPPGRLVFEWSAVNFAAGEKTEVEVTFGANPGGTLVTVTHRGWSKIRRDHPVRHGHDVPEFIRMMGLWWGDLMTSLREGASTSLDATGVTRVPEERSLKVTDDDGLPRKPVVLRPGEGRSYPMGRIAAVFKADGAETGGAYSISEWWLDANTKGPGAHAHPEDDVFFVLEGTMTLLVGDDWVEARAGSFVLIPGGMTHDFENRSAQRAGVLNFSSGEFEPEMKGIAEWFREHPQGDATPTKQTEHS